MSAISIKNDNRIQSSTCTTSESNYRSHYRRRSKSDACKQRRSPIRSLTFLVHLSLLLAIGVKPYLSEARPGSFRTTARGKAILKARPEVSHNGAEANLLLIDPWSASDSRNYRKYPGAPATASSTSECSSPASYLTTDVGGLADCFQQAMGAVNENEDHIHVGRLLSACERLESTMRNIGFSQGANDIGGNISKIRALYEQAPVDQRDSMPSLLRYELEAGIHRGKTEKELKDPSATMGFLWLGRALHYQYDMFNNILEKNEEPFEAAKHAYEQDLKPFHSWPAQKVCQAAMVTLKPMRCDSVLAQMGGFSKDSFGNMEDQATRRDLRQMMDYWKPMLSRWSKLFSDLELENI
jgi:hypothetical protein